MLSGVGEQRALTFVLSNEIVPYEHDIRRFVDAMLYKLKVHSAKGRWENLDILNILGKLDGEVKELRYAVSEGNTIEVVLEAADVANYAMIASSIKVERG